MPMRLCSMVELFQSTHPRGVRRQIVCAALGDLAVSIHAPAWGATSGGGKGPGRHLGFNPRTRVGCDQALEIYKLELEAFQSTHPRGVRRKAQHHHVARGDVSIHAPAWGATTRDSGMAVALLRFNPRTRVGCDPPQGRPFPPRCSFNPRTRVGCDPLAVTNLACRAMFQSTHPRGVRPAEFIATSLTKRKFQSTHPRGVRHAKAGKEYVDEWSFNPRTRVGCDWASWRAPCIPTGFNPRTRVGCDVLPGGRKLTIKGTGFNPRTRLGCDSFHVLSSRFP